MYQFKPVSRRMLDLRDKIRARTIQIDSERSMLLTEAWQRFGSAAPLIRTAEGLYNTCSKLTCPVDDLELLVGSLGKTFCGAGVSTDWFDYSWSLDRVESGQWELAEDGFYYSPPSEPVKYRVHRDDIENFKYVREFWKGKTITSAANAWKPEFWYEIANSGATSYPADAQNNNSSIQIMKVPYGHICPGHKKIIEKGYGAIKREATGWIAAHRGNLMGEDVERYVFYHAAARTCDAGTALCMGYARTCRRQLEVCTDGKRRKELEMMADGLEWISENPARTFWEACQAAIMYQNLVHIESMPPALAIGRFDQYTWPYLKSDLEQGRITMEEAQEICDAFFLKLECFYTGGTGLLAVSSGLGNTYQHTTIGGVDPASGEDATNPVTYMVLETMGRLKLHDPTISLRFNKNTPDELWDCAIETSKRVGGLPLYQNDEVIIPTVVKELGFDLYDARNYCFIGCQEIVGSGVDFPAPSGTNPPHNGIHYGVVLDMALNNGVNPFNGSEVNCKTGYLYEMTDIEQVKSAFEKMARYIFNMYISINNYCEYLGMLRSAHPALSISIEGCMEKGKDCVQGGAKYNSYGGTATGLATIADSLAAIEYMCFDKKLCTARELFDAYMSNWEGHEELRTQILKQAPHFGNNDPYADRFFKWTVELYHDMCKKVYSTRTSIYRSGLYGASDHVMQGYHTWATPDGRKTGTPIADAASPCQGRDRNGPTAIFMSELCFDHTMLADGMALNIKLDTSTLKTQADNNKLRDLTKAYFSKGGMEVQYNIVSAQTMLEAQKHPEEYSDLVVRIAGYSAYFVDLSEDCQNDLISRTAHGL